MSEKLKSVLANLDPKNNNHWTQDGLPKLEILRLLATDSKISREDVTAIAPDLTRESLLKGLVPPVPTVVTEPILQEKPPVPEPEAQTEELDLAYEQDKLARMQAYQVQLTAEILNQQALVDSLIVAEEGETQAPHIQTQNAIQGYLEGVRAKNEARAKMIEEHGPTRVVKTVAPSPLDQALAQKRK